MPAPYRDKHFLEMSDREREARRLAEMQRSGRDAIEGVYPEEMLIPGLKASKEAIKGAGRAIANKVDMAMRPKVENVLVPDMRAAKFPDKYGGSKYALRNVFSQAELDDIRKSGYMMPSPKEVVSGKNRKWFSVGDDPQRSDLRVLSEKVPANRAVRRRDVEVYNKETGEYEPLKKGGAVKSKAFRGDGVAQRGKTKGRFV